MFSRLSSCVTGRTNERTNDRETIQCDSMRVLIACHLATQPVQPAYEHAAQVAMRCFRPPFSGNLQQSKGKAEHRNQAEVTTKSSSPDDSDFAGDSYNAYYRTIIHRKIDISVPGGGGDGLANSFQVIDSNILGNDDRIDDDSDRVRQKLERTLAFVGGIFWSIVDRWSDGAHQRIIMIDVKGSCLILVPK